MSRSTCQKACASSDGRAIPAPSKPVCSACRRPLVIGLFSITDDGSIGFLCLWCAKAIMTDRALRSAVEAVESEMSRRAGGRVS